MKRKVIITVILSIVLLFAIQAVSFSEVNATEGEEIPSYLLDNEFYRESVRLTKLAQETYDYGDYDASTGFAEEAIRYSQLSDEYVTTQLKIKEADDAIAAAKKRLDWAAEHNAAKRYPIEYNQGLEYYNESLADRKDEHWDEAIEEANYVIDLLAYMEGEGPAPVKPASHGDTTAALPKQYTVRTWAEFRDCLWNIAGYPWVYGDPWKWRTLYNANKSQISDPNVIEPGMVLEIPSIKGETREGMWEPGKTYATTH